MVEKRSDAKWSIFWMLFENGTGQAFKFQTNGRHLGFWSGIQMVSLIQSVSWLVFPKERRRHNNIYTIFITVAFQVRSITDENKSRVIFTVDGHITMGYSPWTNHLKSELQKFVGIQMFPEFKWLIFSEDLNTRLWCSKGLKIQRWFIY